MELLIESARTVPSYNGYVITELDDMTAGLEQYWNRRKAFYAQTVERLKLLAVDADAERVWREFCRRHTGFLGQLLKAGADSAERAFQSQLKWKAGLSREARLLFQRDARAEIWIPVSHYPLRLVRTPGQADDYDVVDYSSYDVIDLELGQPIVAISWRGQVLFLILPNLNFVPLDTFEITKDDANWNTQHALPNSFAEISTRFKAELETASRSF